MTTQTKLIRTTYFLGLIPLFVGLSIFFGWWIGKAWFLVTLHRLEGYGFIWILISIPLGLGGLITAIVYLFQVTRENLIKGFGGLFCVLINVPALMWIIDKQNDIEKRAYVRIFNQTGIDFTELTIENSSSKGDYRFLNKDDNKTAYFYPKYLNGDFESVPLVDSVRLVVRTENGVRTIVVPEIYKSECISIVVDKEFNIESK
jgi:hypothetical protein